MPPARTRPLRADARENEDRLLQAAARAFARDGTQASLKAIAQDAGVGIATLYRRFPTREQLVEATYRSEVERVADAATDLAAGDDPVTALHTWMTDFIALLAVKYGMAETLRAALAGQDAVRGEIRAALTTALTMLIEAGAAAGVLRADVDPSDVLLALGGIAMIAGDAAQAPEAERLIGLLLDGLQRGAGRA